MAIGSHTIPKYYLEQFSTPSTRPGNPGRVWVYERGKEPDERATSVQGVENGYFGYVKPDGILEESLETQLASLEAECHEILRSAKSELFNWRSFSHRKTFASYVSLLFQRATQSRNVNEEHWDYVQKGFAEAISDDKYVADLAVHYGRRFNQDITITEMRGHLQRVAEGMQRPAEAKNVFLEKLLWNTEFIREILLEKQWQVLKASTGAEVVRSGNQVISFVRLPNDELPPAWGFRRRGCVIALPRSTADCLL